MSGRRKPKKTTPKIRYFFYEGDLHKKIHINRGDDIIAAWNYPKGKLVKYPYSSVRKYGEQAFSTTQVSKMIRRGRQTIVNAFMNGWIEQPQFTYGLDENRNMYSWYWSEKDIMNLHGYLKTVHQGRPRHDGEINTGNLPSAAELRAMIRQGTVLYVKNEDGEFVRTWEAEKF